MLSAREEWSVLSAREEASDECEGGAVLSVISIETFASVSVSMSMLYAYVCFYVYL